MNLRPYSLTIYMGLLILGLNGCGFVRQNDEGFPAKQTYISRSGDKEIHFPIPDKDVPGYPSWRPGSPFPLAIDSAITTAMKELPRYTRESKEWEFHGVSLSSLHTDGPISDKWVYLVQFQQKGNSNLLEIPIALNGSPIPGIEQPLDKHRWSN